MDGQYKSGSLSLTANSEDLIDFVDLIQKVDSPKKLVQLDSNSMFHSNGS